AEKKAAAASTTSGGYAVRRSPESGTATAAVSAAAATAVVAAPAAKAADNRPTYFNTSDIVGVTSLRAAGASSPQGGAIVRSNSASAQDNGVTFVQSSEIVRGHGTTGSGGANGFSDGGVRQVVVAGPGYPQGYEPTDRPNYSGLLDQRGQAYTDNKDDSIMAVLVHRMNNMDSALRADSEQLAQAVSRVNLIIDRQVVSLDLSFQFEDRVVEATFSGYLNNRHASTNLTQRSGSEQFNVHMLCADAQVSQNVLCRNAILTIDQLKDGQVCRRIYAVHRWMFDKVGDGHFTLSKEDFELSTKIYEEDKAIQKAQKENKKYEKELVVKNRALRAFLRLVGNTIHYNRVFIHNEPVRLASGENTQLARTPRLGFLGVRSWAVAYGPSFVEITMNKAKAGGNGALSDSTRFFGLLTKPRMPGELATDLNREGEYSTPQIDDRYDERLAQTIQKAALLDNDGRGNLALNLEFKDSKVGVASSRVNFTGLHLNVLSSNELLEVVPK
ncbi:MAG: hypothetical protein AB7N80_15120, partial [Bdellovibrionales bacterium]